jgi:hypothetical protein
LSRIVRVETKEGGITVEYEVSTDPASYVPPPDGWQWAGCVMAGDGACMVEKLLVRGFARRQAPTWLFMHRGERKRQDLSHEEDIAGIIERCRPHGITVDAGEVYDDTDCVRMDRPFRVFRHWRMTGEGCPWDPAEPFDHCFMIVDGKTLCRACGQERKHAWMW